MTGEALSRIAAHISEATGWPFRPSRVRHLGGGCINETLLLDDGRHQWFVKLNRADLLDMFEAEAAGLEALSASGTLRTPKPLCHGLDGGRSFLVLEYIEMSPPRWDSASQAGRELAAMHLRPGETFGWHRDNRIGSTPQKNGQAYDWIDFWREKRLGFQLHLAASNGYGGALQERGGLLMARFPALIDHAPSPSLLHGDLWAGNMAYDRDGNPVIFDPAVYYGDPEVDLAMTELFGGFGDDFYAAYAARRPLDPGYPVRKILYNLYHILNHLNLFGGGYLAQSQSMIDRLLAEC
ncbi:MAG: fructosamine kinase family protein [Gammaproteobacteria bacterium]|nr:fructosamine kinase family protein [Gammaproteobacteria bacterium]MBU1656356.1 fructosamine kinase family protein [Gammaproteobacteria bacterium]MBU1959920.1 fructosamine kinase family protein [Gammaproteobacteria bacterium]